jgi:hypothetical protein
MNEDVSAGIDATVRIGAKIPLLSTIGFWLIVADIITLAVAIILLYFGIRHDFDAHFRQCFNASANAKA